MARRAGRGAASALAAVLTTQAGLATGAATHTAELSPNELLTQARAVRAIGCPGHPGITTPLEHSIALDLAAQHWSRGERLSTSIVDSGFRAVSSSGVHINGAVSSIRATLAHALCEPLADRSVSAIGWRLQRGQLWLIVAAPFDAPARNSAAVAAELLRRINDARASARRCGRRSFQAVPPLHMESRLTDAAREHAQDMLTRNYFEHVGPDGSTPATRVAATGYRYALVGENIAEGPTSAVEAVTGWLASPGHCENIMDPRFRDTGFAFAANVAGTPRIYWVEEFALAR